MGEAKQDSKIGGTIVVRCENWRCESEYQDKRYGKGQRVHNFCKGGARCTVCLNVRKGGD